MKKIRKIHIVATTGKPHVKAALDRFMPWLGQRVEVLACVEDGAPPAPEACAVPDCVLVLGGDGTMLLAARHYAPFGVPVFGINLGKFGFLTQTTGSEAFESIERMLDGAFEIEERMMMLCRLQRDGEIAAETPCLNDAVLSRTALSRLLTIDLFVDGGWINTYRADGLIVATPVGSTAHSLAASGPILTPDLNAFVICPICPHTLSNRPIVISADARLELRPRDYSEQPALTVDGQVFHPLGRQDTVRIERAKTPLRLIKTGERTFFEILREKLGWSGQLNYVEDKREKL